MNLSNLFIFEFIDNKINFDNLKNILQQIRIQFTNNIIVFVYDPKDNISNKILNLSDKNYKSKKNNKMFSLINQINFTYDKCIHILFPNDININSILLLCKKKLNKQLIVSNDEYHLIIQIFDSLFLQNLENINYISYKNIIRF